MVYVSESFGDTCISRTRPVPHPPVEWRGFRTPGGDPMQITATRDDIWQALTEAQQTLAVRKAHGLPIEGTQAFIDTMLDEYLRSIRGL